MTKVEQGNSSDNNRQDIPESMELADSTGPAESTESLAEDEALESSLQVHILPLRTGHGCSSNCHQNKSENRQLRNRVKSLRSQLTAKKKANKRKQRLGK